jgi:hypothetical protein
MLWGFCGDNIIATIQSPWHHSSRRGQIGNHFPRLGLRLRKAILVVIGILPLLSGSWGVNH